MRHQHDAPLGNPAVQCTYVHRNGKYFNNVNVDANLWKFLVNCRTLGEKMTIKWIFLPPFVSLFSSSTTGGKF